MDYIPITAVQDESGHWYLIPIRLLGNFRRDLEDEDMADSGKFDELYGEYRTGGDLNLVQLYIESK